MATGSKKEIVPGVYRNELYSIELELVAVSTEDENVSRDVIVSYIPTVRKKRLMKKDFEQIPNTITPQTKEDAIALTHLYIDHLLGQSSI